MENIYPNIYCYNFSKQIAFTINKESRLVYIENLSRYEPGDNTFNIITEGDIIAAITDCYHRRFKELLSLNEMDDYKYYITIYS